MSRKNNVSSAMLQPGRKAASAGKDIFPAEIPMVLTLDQLEPNPDNPRTTRNPRYDNIKASIHSRGLDTVPKVTRDPNDDRDKYMFSDGGNTRYQILAELWRETGDERFYRINVLVKPWPGRLRCVIGHLVENEVRGDLSFIEKAGGVHKARTIYEEQLGKPVSLRELSTLLADEGLPVDVSSISRMEGALRYLYPWMPGLLESGLGRPQINALLVMRQSAERIWHEFSDSTDSNDESSENFGNVFGECCRKFNAPDLWALEMFRDEFIGDLLQALPHPDLNYDRWMMELDPKEQHRRYESETCLIQTPETDWQQQENSSMPAPSVAASPYKNPSSPAFQEVQPERYGVSGDTTDISLTRDFDNSDSDEALMSLLSPCKEDEYEDGDNGYVIPDANDGDEIWLIRPYYDDISHLQKVIFLNAWELAEELGCGNEIVPDQDHRVLSAGYTAAGDYGTSAAFLLSLAGEPALLGELLRLDTLLIGGSSEQDAPILNDEHAKKLLRLMRLMRRLRELQREANTDRSQE